MCAKFGIIVIANNDLAMGGGTYEIPYILHNLNAPQSSHCKCQDGESRHRHDRGSNPHHRLCILAFESDTLTL